MKRNLMCNRLAVRKCLFALPRGMLCIRKRPIRGFVVKIQEEEEKSNDELHEG